MRKTRIGITGVLALGAVMLITAPRAMATDTTQPAPKVTGSAFLSDPTYPSQYLSVSAFASTSTSPMKGSVTYANYTYRCPGSGAWQMGTSATVWFIALGAYNWDLTVTPGQWTGGAYTFNGTAVAEFDGTTATVSGTVNGSTVSIHMVYTSGYWATQGYYLDAVGAIQPDGSVVGTSFSDTLGRDLAWGMPAGAFFEFLGYTAPVTAVAISGSTAKVSFVIPASCLAGYPVTMTIVDGGSPGAVYDSVGWGAPETIVSGNFVVH